MRAIRPLTVLVLLVLPACGGGEPPDASAAEQPSDAAPAQATDAAAARPTEGSSEASAPAPVVPVGTSLTFIVGEKISTSDHEAGHTFTSILEGDAMGVDGATALPAGTIGRWIVTESTDDDGQGAAVLAMRLEAIDVGGAWYPVTATVTEAQLSTDQKDSNTETAAKIGIGAAAGAIAGKVLGGSTGATLKGAGVGAAMGTVVALSTRGGSATLEKDARITVTLDEPLTLSPR